MKTCDVNLVGAGRLAYSRRLLVPVGGLRVLDPGENIAGVVLPRSERTIGWELTLTNAPTASGATATYLMHAENSPLSEVSSLAAMANGGFGELLAPGQSTVITLPGDLERLNLDMQGVESDFTTEASCLVYVSIKELVALPGIGCVEKGC